MSSYLLFMNSIKLREIRKARGLNQTELAAMIGVTQSAIGHYERGIRTIEAQKLTVLAKILEVSTDEILGIKPVAIQEKKKAVHGNSRTAQIQEVFEKLKPAKQRQVLGHAKALLKEQ